MKAEKNKNNFQECIVIGVIKQHSTENLMVYKQLIHNPGLVVQKVDIAYLLIRILFIICLLKRKKWIRNNDVEIKSMETMNYPNYLFSELKSFSVQDQNLNHNQK